MTNEVTVKSTDVILREISGMESIDQMETDTVDMSVEYWSPKDEGETKRLVFVGIKKMLNPSHDNPDELVDLDTVIFAQKLEDGTVKQTVNASALMLGIFEKEKHNAPFPVEIKFTGKKKTKSGNMCDGWSVKKLIAKKG